MSICDWGWDAQRAAEAANLLSGDWRVCRVIGQGRDLYTLTDGESTRPSPVSGAFRYRAALPSDYPVTGDFVACREGQETWVIEQVLPRRGTLSRKTAGKLEEQQLLAANLDGVFLVFALDGGRGFVPGLVERLLTLARDGGVTPVVLLNKADLAESLPPQLEAARACAPGVEVLATSAATGQNVHALRERLEPGRTYLFLGKSGVGKSSLLNALFGKEVAKTAETRAADGKGRHTTSNRELFLLPNGALLVDSPGVREAALWAEEGSVQEAFPEVAALSRQCRYRDCSHSEEPGCAVREALEAGSLDRRRFESYLTQRRETRFHQLQGAMNAQRLERMRWKQISRKIKDLYRERDRP